MAKIANDIEVRSEGINIIVEGAGIVCSGCKYTSKQWPSLKCPRCDKPLGLSVVRNGVIPSIDWVVILCASAMSVQMLIVAGCTVIVSDRPVSDIWNGWTAVIQVGYMGIGAAAIALAAACRHRWGKIPSIVRWGLAGVVGVLFIVTIAEQCVHVMTS